MEALLIVEVEGSEEEIAEQLGRILEVARRHDPEVLRESGSEEESALIWKGRKAAFGAMGQIADYICLDGTIPVGELPFVLRRIGELTAGYGLGVANVFHAGDGNMHPLILYDANKPGDLDKAEALGADILRLCVEVGGCLTGEHGVGVEKRDLMDVQYGAADLEAQLRVKDVFDPALAAQPGQGVPAGVERRAAGGVTAFAPTSEEELAAIVRAAPAGGFAVEGGGTRGIGRPAGAARLVTGGPGGITLYEPGALTLVVRAGTPLAEVEAALAARGAAAAVRAVGRAAADRGERRADDRGHGGDERLGAAAVSRRGVPGQHDRGAVRRRHRGDRQERRAGDEERHRARPRQADGGQPRHARGDDRGGVQGAAAAGDARRRWCWTASTPRLRWRR